MNPPVNYLPLPVAVLLCGLALAWVFLTVRRSGFVTTGQSRAVYALLAICSICIILAHLALFPQVNLAQSYTLLFDIACIAVIWNGLRLLRAANRAGAP